MDFDCPFRNVAKEKLIIFVDICYTARKYLRKLDVKYLVIRVHYIILD